MARYSFGVRKLTEEQSDELQEAAEIQAAAQARVPYETTSWWPNAREWVEGVRWDDPEPESEAEQQADRARDDTRG